MDGAGIEQGTDRCETYLCERHGHAPPRSGRGRTAVFECQAQNAHVALARPTQPPFDDVEFTRDELNTVNMRLGDRGDLES